MNTNERLLYTIGEIDDKLISEAATPYNYKRKLFFRIGTAAASLILTFTVVIMAMSLFGVMDSDMTGSDFGDGFGGNGNAPTADSYTDSYILYSSAGSIQLLEVYDDKLTFRLDISDNTERIDVYVTLNDGYGNEMISSTDGTAEHMPKISVNGEPAELIPTKKGTYTVILDFSELTNRGYIISEKINVVPIGDFDLTDR